MGGKFLEFRVDIEGQTELRRGIAGVDDSVSDLSAAWEGLKEDFYSVQRGIFEAEGAFDGREKWQGLTPAYLKLKKKLKANGSITSLKILQASERLKNSLSGNTSDSVLIMKKMEFAIGTNLEYAIYHQSNKPRKKLPRRAFLTFTKSMRNRWMLIMKNAIKNNINLKLAQQK